MRCRSTSGRAELHPLNFKKLADIASPVLLQTCATGKTIHKALFEFMRADGDGKPIPYFKIELENLTVPQRSLSHEPENPTFTWSRFSGRLRCLAFGHTLCARSIC